MWASFRFCFWARSDRPLKVSDRPLKVGEALGEFVALFDLVIRAA